MIFAAIVGAAVFDDRITWLTVAAALVIVASVALYQRRPATTRTEGAGDV
jgi:drug/metabolite transporter (DMT)-like permease